MSGLADADWHIYEKYRQEQERLNIKLKSMRRLLKQERLYVTENFTLTEKTAFYNTFLKREGTLRRNFA